jgi:hypothetical protein
MRATYFPLACVPLALCAQQLDFNRDVRPILSDRCFACHGPDEANRKSKLRLDIEGEAKSDLGNGRRGIVPGDWAASEVYKRITSRHPIQRMPPRWAGKDPLPEREVEILKKWVAEGAGYRAHWSFEPPIKRAPPPVARASWVRNPLDAWILSRLAKEGLAPAPEADKSTLLRRVTLDLTGLPPSPKERDAFLNDAAENAYDKAVDRLLASPRYAERMAIRWLEAARYSDTNGYQTDGPRDMWRWRDWVIEAFHKNMPFDRFTIEQIAGDLLPGATMEQKLATGFHRNHRTSAEGGIVDEEFRVEYVADRTETTATVWLGLTMGCARCHDHKYDPIPQKDFYSLFAFYNNVPEKGFVWNFGNEEPVIKAPLPDQQKRLDELDARLAEARRRLDRLEPRIARAQAGWEKRLRGDANWTVTGGQSVHAALDEHPTLKSVEGPAGKALEFDGKNFVESDGKPADFNYREPFTFAGWVKPEGEDGAILSHADDYFEGSGHALYVLKGKLRLHAIFRWTDLGMRVESAEPLRMGEWQHVLVTYDGGMKAGGVKMYVNGAPVKTTILFDSMLWPIEVKAPFRVGAGGGLRFKGAIGDVRVYRRALTAEEAAVAALVQRLKSIALIPRGGRTPAQRAKLRMAFLETAAPSAVKTARARLARIEEERAKFYDSIPTSMVMAEREQPRETFVLKRGAYDAPGERVGPGVPAFLPKLPEGERRDRLALARWLVSRENPLTARVTVNRLWQMLFGTGIVKTVEDFGSQGEPPVHPELLDWLAVEFMDSGWDIKHIMRLLVTSATYRQSSKAAPALLQRDPENRLLARGPRFRLPAEMIRDQALAVSGLLVEKTGGESVRPYQPPGLWQELHGGKGYEQDKGEGLWRRSLYTYWKRTVAPPMMINFDSPNREVCTVRVSNTNTPLQALNLMNDVTFLEASRRLAERMMTEGGKKFDERLRFGMRLTLARDPKAEESGVLKSFYEKLAAYYAARPGDAESYLKQGEAPRDKTLDVRDLAAWTALANLLLNLDEAVTKE